MKKDKSYKINEGHLFSFDGVVKEGLGYLNLFINDLENGKDECFYDEEKRIEFLKLCINFDNYFATLASILKFSVETSNLEKSNLGIILDKIEKDLLYLQMNYMIVEREKKE